MLFNSIEYIFVFLPVVFCLYFLLNKAKFYNVAKVFLLLASLFFYGSYRIEYVPILLILILFNYLVSFSFKLNITENTKKIIIVVGVLSNVLILLYFKYFNFLVQELMKFINSESSIVEVILPLGISFYTLQQISYIVDCFKGNIKNYNILDYALYICFFPQLIAGPIVRHQEMIPQFRDLSRRVINQDNIFVGFFLITVGLIKKTILADNFVGFLNYVDEINLYNEFYIVWTMGVAKLLQMYFDFSGYCDIALGSAFLFNISLPWNFNSPFKASSIVDYWKRWNMTFIRFLKDYVYKPLGANKKGTLINIINIMIVFLLLGLWGGCNLVSVFYGILNGVLVCICVCWQKLNIKLNTFVAKSLTILSLIFTVQFICVKNISELLTVFRTMFGFQANFHMATIENFDMVFSIMPPHNAKFNFIIFILALYFVLFSKNSTELARFYVKENKSIYTFILAILFVVATLSITQSNDFVYFIF